MPSAEQLFAQAFADPNRSPSVIFLRHARRLRAHIFLMISREQRAGVREARRRCYLRAVRSVA